MLCYLIFLQYFLPFATQGINIQIEAAILKADKLGVKVISLAALNKVNLVSSTSRFLHRGFSSIIRLILQNESLNGGGTLFTNKHPNLNVRVVHGNTLTAAVILHEIPLDVEEVFLTGATSKLGRAVALYLARRKVKVLVRTSDNFSYFCCFLTNIYKKRGVRTEIVSEIQMLTLSTERFSKIQKEAPPDCQKYLVQVTKYQAAQTCKVILDSSILESASTSDLV